MKSVKYTVKTKLEIGVFKSIFRSEHAQDLTKSLCGGKIAVIRITDVTNGECVYRQPFGKILKYASKALVPVTSNIPYA